MFNRMSFRLMLSVIMVTSLGCLNNVQSQDEGTAEVEEEKISAAVLSSIKGTVKIKIVDGEWKYAEEGEELNPGDKIKTDKGASVDLSFESGAVSSLEEKTGLAIKSSSADYEGDDYETTLKLVLGKVLVNVEKLEDENLSFKVETPVAVAAVRGTEFVVDVTNKEDTSVAAFSGEVTVRKRGKPDSVIVKKNRKISVKKKEIKLKKPFKIDRKTLKLKKKFVKLKSKAKIHRKTIKLRRKTIRLRKKSSLKLKDKKKIKGKKGKVKLKKDAPIKTRKKKIK